MNNKTDNTCPKCGEEGTLQVEKGRYVKIFHYSPEKYQKSKKGKGMYSCYIGSLSLIANRAERQTDQLKKKSLLLVKAKLSSQKTKDFTETSTDVGLFLEILNELRQDKVGRSAYERGIENAKEQQHRFPRACPECGNVIAVHVVRKGKMHDTWLEKESSLVISNMGFHEGPANRKLHREDMNCPYCHRRIATLVEYYGAIRDVELRAWRIY